MVFSDIQESRMQPDMVHEKGSEFVGKISTTIATLEQTRHLVLDHSVYHAVNSYCNITHTSQVYPMPCKHV